MPSDQKRRLTRWAELGVVRGSPHQRHSVRVGGIHGEFAFRSPVFVFQRRAYYTPDDRGTSTRSVAIG